MAIPAWETLQYDVVVVGAGAAGLRAAIEAAREGAHTAVVCKSLLGKAGTVMAEDGIAAAAGNANKEDGWRSHFRDTVRGGWLVNDWRMAYLHSREAPEHLRELETWGALFDRSTDGGLMQWQSAGHRYPRCAGRAGRTGLEVLRILQSQAVGLGIDIHMECDVKRLVLAGSRVAGAFGYRRTTGEFVLFRCGAVVLATGAAGRAWKASSSPADATGDGLALALHAGAQLVDMEFTHFHPTALATPTAARGLLVSESIFAIGAVLRNALGTRFLFDYVPGFLRPDIASTAFEADAWCEKPFGNRRPPELMPADVVSSAIDAEVRAGRGTAAGGVLLDVRAGRFAGQLAHHLAWLNLRVRQLANADVAKGPIEVAPACRSPLGGVRVDPYSGASTVGGLFAVGQVAAGLHGAARLGGNALSEALVFGRRGGLHAAHYCRLNTRVPSVDPEIVEDHMRELLAPFRRGAGESPYILQRELQNCMSRFVGIVRSGDELERARRTIADLRCRSRNVVVTGGRTYNPGWHLALDLDSLLWVAEATTLASSQRRESRGCHMRRDFPSTDPNYGVTSIVISRTNDTLVVSQQPVAEIPRQLRRLVDWRRTWLANTRRSRSGAAMTAAASSKNIA